MVCLGPSIPVSPEPRRHASFARLLLPQTFYKRGCIDDFTRASPAVPCLRSQCRQIVCVFDHQLCPFLHQRGTLFGGFLPPAHLRLFCINNSLRRLRRGDLRNAAENLAGRRINHVFAFAIFAVQPFAIDQALLAQQCLMFVA